MTETEQLCICQHKKEPELISPKAIRVAIAASAFLLPLALWFGGRWLGHSNWLTSISIYYHTGLRDILVIGGGTIGLLLLLYLDIVQSNPSAV